MPQVFQKITGIVSVSHRLSRGPLREEARPQAAAHALGVVRAWTPPPSRRIPQAAPSRFRRDFGKSPSQGPWVQVCDRGGRGKRMGRLPAVEPHWRRWRGSLGRGPAGGAAPGGPSAPAVNLADLQPATVRSPPVLGRTPGPAGTAEGEEPLRSLRSSEARGLAATPEPSPRRRQVSGGPGKLADSPEAGLATRRSWRERGRTPGRQRRGPEPAAHVAPEVTFGRSQVSSPVLAAAQPHGSGAAKSARGQCPARSGLRTEPPAGSPRPHAPARPRAAGIPATLLIHRGTRRRRRPRRSPLLSPRPSDPSRLPALAGALPATRYSPGAPSCALPRDGQGALCERRGPGSPLRPQPRRPGGDPDPTNARRRERKAPAPLGRRLPPASPDLGGD